VKILLLGDFLWNRFAASYGRAFKSLGLAVIPFDTRQEASSLARWLRGRVGNHLAKNNLPLRRVGSARLNDKLLAVASDTRPDLVLILNGDFVMPMTVRRLRTRGTRVFIFHADNPFPPHSSSRPEHIPGALESDCYFIWSRALQARLQDSGVRRVEYLPFAWDPCVFPHVGLAGRPHHDVVFVGGWDTYREHQLTPIARKFDLSIWGPPYWGTRTAPNSPLRRSWQGSTATGLDASRILADSKIVINVLRAQNLPDGTVMRTFEVPGAGGFLISTRTQGAADIFPEECAGAYFDDVDECMEMIERFLADDRLRREIAGRAHSIVESDHTYVHRAGQILDVWSRL